MEKNCIKSATYVGFDKVSVPLAYRCRIVFDYVISCPSADHSLQLPCGFFRKTTITGNNFDVIKAKVLWLGLVKWDKYICTV
jgi:hypothetical protein